MKTILIKALVVCSVLSGCAQTPAQIPYKTIRVIDHESKLLPIQFPLGITQERLGENQYRITAKLAEFGTHERAESMALYHASILAEQQGYNAFIMDDIRKPSWCGHSNSKATKFIGNVSGGVTAKLIITLAKAEKVEQNNKLFLAQRTKILNRAVLNKVPTEIELEQISSERLEHCLNKAKSKRYKR